MPGSKREPVVTHLIVGIEPVDVEPGQWCDRCLLPSAIKVTFVFYDGATLKVTGRGDRTWCPDCGRFVPRALPG